MHNIFSSTIPIIFIIILGSIIKRKWLTSEEFWRGVEKLSYFLLFPLVLFNYASSADLTGLNLTKLTIALIISSSLISIALIIYKEKNNNIDNIQFTSMFQGSIRYSTYIFFGFGNSLFGSEGLLIISVISAYMIIFTNICSVLVFAKYVPAPADAKDKKYLVLVKLVITNPLIVASVLGMMFNYSSLELHLGLKNTIIMLSNSALAMGMLNVGAGLKFMIPASNFRQVMFTSVVKLLAFPLVTGIILYLMSITGIERSIGLLYACLPCANTSYILSRQLGGDPESMASIVTFTTIFSVVSLSILMYILI